MFKIITCGGPVAPWVGGCIKSVRSQISHDWEMVVTLDPCGDQSYGEAMRYADDKVCVMENSSKKYALANIVQGIKILKPDDEDILVFLDADDQLANPGVLSTLKVHYEEDPGRYLVSHGSYIEQESKRPGDTNQPYVPGDIPRHIDWRASHLRTMKYKVWKEIKDEDLRGPDGKYLIAAWDFALMFPAMELVGLDRVKHIPEILYLYNALNPHGDWHLRGQQQIDLSNYVRSKPMYDKVEF